MSDIHDPVSRELMNESGPPDESQGAAWVPSEPPGEPDAAPDDLLILVDDDTEEGVDEEVLADPAPMPVPNLAPAGKGRKRSLQKPKPRVVLDPEQRLLVLDTWLRSGLPAKDFAPLVGVSKHTLYLWKKRFEAEGPGGLVDKPRGSVKGSRLSDVTKRAIKMMKEANPDWGVQRISDLLLRGPGLSASPQAVARYLHELGYELEEHRPRRHDPNRVRRFERARPMQLWQTDLFSFVLKRQNRRVHMVCFMDDHSRFLVSYGLHATASASLVIETMRSGIASYGSPEEVLTDNGSQYVTWRGKSAFAKECDARGIKQIVATPRRPQTLGKIERFWGTLWRECVERAIFVDLEDARRRIGHFIDHYNLQRPHQGIGSVVPADRFFETAPAILRTLKERAAANALELARGGIPKPPLYLVGNVGGKQVSIHGEGERVVFRQDGETRQEVDLNPPAAAPIPEPTATESSPPVAEDALGQEPPTAPGHSVIDELFNGQIGDAGSQA